MNSGHRIVRVDVVAAAIVVRPLITLTTDFGWSSYVAQMKGVLLTGIPDLELVDITHDIPPQDIVAGGLAIADAVPWFPPHALHLVVVDPGVGTSRHLLFVESEGSRLIAPDNGVLGLLLENRKSSHCFLLNQVRHGVAKISPTFHGRDIIAPIACKLLAGVEPSCLGTMVRTESTCGFPLPPAVRSNESWIGSLLAPDRFGNAISNISSVFSGLEDFENLPASAFRVRLGDHSISPQWSKTYADVLPGQCLALIGSSGRLEIAIHAGNAWNELGLKRGQSVELCRRLQQNP